jgi:hypothetical protein
VSSNYPLGQEDLEVLNESGGYLWSTLAELNVLYENAKQDANSIARNELALKMSAVVQSIMDLYHFERFISIEGDVS